MKNKAGTRPVRATALRQYQRLETHGLWRESPEANWRDVVVSFGEASLVISDFSTDRALTHWSLPAVERLNPDERPARFAPGHDAGEAVQIEDETMIDALEKVRGVVVQRQRHPGRMRLWALMGVVLALLALGALWLPGALITHTASVVPYAKRVEIGQRILQDLARNGVLACQAPLGQRAAGRLRDRVLGPNGGEIVVLDRGLAQTAHLPGRHVLVGRSLLEGHDAPELVAGHVIAERLRADSRDPMLDVLRAAGLPATFQLLTTGEISDHALRGYGAAVIARPPEPVDTDAFIARMEAAGIPTTPYARSVDPTGASVLQLIEDDPFRTVPPRPVMSDGDWISLQGICNG